MLEVDLVYRRRFIRGGGVSDAIKTGVLVDNLWSFRSILHANFPSFIDPRIMVGVKKWSLKLLLCTHLVG